jgi:hypothetical protein
MVPSVASGERNHVRQGVEIGWQSELFLSAQIDKWLVQIHDCSVQFQYENDEQQFGAEEVNLPELSMCGWREAPFLGQLDGFSCRNSHAFNRPLMLQVTAGLQSSYFPPFTFGYLSQLSPEIPLFSLDTIHRRLNIH